MALLHANPLALRRRQTQDQLFKKRKACVPPSIKPPTVPRRITYKPLQREAAKRREDVQSSVLKLAKDYTQYGSSNGDWRNVICIGKRFALPPGCEKRRSMRLS